MTDFNIDPADTVIPHDQDIHYKFFVMEVYEAIVQLPEPIRRLLYLRVFEDYNYKEIKELTGLPMGTIKSRIGRGRKHLKRLLEKFE